MKRTLAAALFALLTVTAPAHAYTITTENVNLDFGNGYTAIGNLTIDYIPVYIGGTPFAPCANCQSNLQLYLNDAPLPPYDGRYGDLRGLGNLTGWPVLFLLPLPPGYPLSALVQSLSVVSLNHVPTNFTDFVLNDIPAISGDVTCTGGCAVTPLPAALPLFGAALAGLGGAGWSKRRRKVS